MKIDLGDFKSRIKITKISKTKSATGSPVDVKEVLKSCWSKQISVAGGEEEEGKIIALYDAAFIVKYDRDLTKGKANGWLIEDLEEAIEFTIEDVVEIEFRKFLRINAVKSE